MADMKSAQLLLQDLPKSDALKALYELTTWIESVREHKDFRLDYQLAVLRLLDETARPFERKLTREYFTDKSLTPFQENRIWVALNDFFLQVSQAYLNIQMQYRNGSKGSQAIQPLLPLIAARGICALKGRLKCAAEHYMLPDQTIWGSLAGLYAHAEEARYLDEPVALYAGTGASTSVTNVSVRKEFSRLLMWYASGASSLNPLQVHLAERLSAHFCPYFNISSQRGPDSLFCFDLQRPTSPIRVNAETRSGPGLRFLSAGSVQAHIKALLAMLDKEPVVPESINLGGVFDAGAVKDVVHHLADFWVSALPVRRDARHRVLVKIYVTQGYSSLMREVDARSAPGSGISEPWAVEDISVSGVRCVLTPSRAKGVEIGLLLGTMPERGTHWGAGIVRRLSRDGQNNLHVGIEMLGKQMTAIELHGSASGTGDVQRALWLNDDSEDSEETSLLMSLGAFSGSRSLHAELAGKNYLLVPLALLEKGADYDLARYRKVAEEMQ
jgi:hypothetical protein